MSLTLGNGPFSPEPGGMLSSSPQNARTGETILLFEPSPRRVRVVFNGETVAESTFMRRLHETGELPVYYFPHEDVRTRFLEDEGTGEGSPLKGPRRSFTVRVDDRSAEGAAWSHPEPPDGAPELSGYVAFEFNAMDAWYEEDEEIEIHPRDPYHRVDARRSRRHLVARIDGEVVAETDRPLAVYETSLSTRWYVPREDLAHGLLEESEKVTGCPYKGRARHHHLALEGGRRENGAWDYPDPNPGLEALRGHVAFYQAEIELTPGGSGGPGEEDSLSASASRPVRPQTVQEEAGVAPSQLEEPPQAEGER